MSCPYFYPVEPRAGDNDTRSAMLPLGGLWTGMCHAVAGEVEQPDDAAVRPLCHLGYARGKCPRFPADDPGADAVRFSISRDDGSAVYLYYVLERDHHPSRHGPLEYTRALGRFVAPPPDAAVCRQAEAYLASYLRNKERARAAAV